MTLFGSVIHVMVGLIEVMLYTALTSGEATTVRVATAPVPGLHHAYLLVAAPMVLAPFAVLLLRTGTVARVLADLALLPGRRLRGAGVCRHDRAPPERGGALSAFQGIWWLETGIATLGRRPQAQAADPCVTPA